MSTILDQIWEKDSYSEPLLRKEKTNFKFQSFEKILT